MSLFNHIGWWTGQDDPKCSRDAVEVANCAPHFGHGRWSFLGPGNEEKWYGTSNDTPKGKWNDIAHTHNRIIPIEHPNVLIHWKGFSSNADVEEKLLTSMPI